VAAHGRQPEHFAAESHAAIYVLVDAVRRAGSTSPEAVRDALATTKNLDTVLGSLSMSAEGDAVLQPVFQQFQSGRLAILR
jgi:branched-chain amino acid transport system substrate-binding protein